MRPYCFLFIVVLAGCGLATGTKAPSNRRTLERLPAPSAEATRSAGLSPTAAADALKLYNAKCLRCHKSYDPHAYTAAQWESWMSRMNRKAHLNTDQQDLLGRYLQAVRNTDAEKTK